MDDFFPIGEEKVKVQGLKSKPSPTPRLRGTQERRHKLVSGFTQHWTGVRAVLKAKETQGLAPGLSDEARRQKVSSKKKPH